MENNYAFIDGQNLHMGTSLEGWQIDFARFRKYLRSKYSVSQAYFFIGYMPKYKDLYSAIETAGFRIVFKEVIKDHHGNIKGNVDAELVLAAATQIDNYDKAILVTADGDFACLVEHLYKHGKLRMVLSPSKKYCSSLLRKKARGRLRALMDCKSRIEKKEKGATGR